ncbi:transposase [Oscillatoria sp. CS-180]|uniref:transposase n=1 Tax=Oscillatoria sp. CS-180 TaxID=3021720 RepID=UPI00232F8094|nr:transposase [Oscillatoria sp. CS-180]MDB9527337.1 transposase [Oscillatoria sp. CS-180]
MAFWLYGVVEPLSGWQWTQTYGQLNRENFQQFLDDLSQQLGETVAMMQVDGAPAHRAKKLNWTENIIPIFHPPHCPELNAVERLWQHLKGQWKGENFPSLEASATSRARMKPVDSGSGAILNILISLWMLCYKRLFRTRFFAYHHFQLVLLTRFLAD